MRDWQGGQFEAGESWAARNGNALSLATVRKTHHEHLLHCLEKNPKLDITLTVTQLHCCFFFNAFFGGSALNSYFFFYKYFYLSACEYPGKTVHLLYFEYVRQPLMSTIYTLYFGNCCGRRNVAS